MLIAILSNIGKYLAGLFVKYVVQTLTKLFKRGQRRKAQAKKDEATKPAYDQAVQSGDDHAIENATEDRLNG